MQTDGLFRAAADVEGLNVCGVLYCASISTFYPYIVGYQGRNQYRCVPRMRRPSRGGQPDQSNLYIDNGVDTLSY